MRTPVTVDSEVDARALKRTPERAPTFEEVAHEYRDRGARAMVLLLERAGMHPIRYAFRLEEPRERERTA